MLVFLKYLSGLTHHSVPKKTLGSTTGISVNMSRIYMNPWCVRNQYRSSKKSLNLGLNMNFMSPAGSNYMRIYQHGFFISLKPSFRQLHYSLD